MRTRTSRTGSRGPLCLVTLNRRAATALNEQIRRQLRDAIDAGRLAPGAPLPSSRTLAHDLGVSRATVVLAYEHLRAEGWIDTHAGRSARVAPAIAWPVRATSSSRASSPSTSPARASSARARLSARGAALAAADPRVLFESSAGTPRPFTTAQPAVDLSPVEIWGRLLARRWRRSPPRALGYGDPRGLLDLRRATAAYLGRARGVTCTADQIVITQGAQQALDIVSRVLLDHGDEVWMEEPGYPGARLAFTAAGARVVPAPVDDEGLRVDVAEGLAPRARLAFVTPARQMPLGGVMSQGRRAALLAWAAVHRAWIVEDDYDSEFRYASRQIAALQALDRHGSVVHIGTFTKALFPALRLGYAVVPQSAVAAMASAKRAMDLASPYLEQAVMADFLDDGHFDRHVRRLRTAYRARLGVLERAVAASMQGLATLAPSDAGRAVILWLSPGLDERVAVEAARADGLHVTPYSSFCTAPDPRQGLILGYGGLRERALREGIQRLAAVLRRVRARRRTARPADMIPASR